MQKILVAIGAVFLVVLLFIFDAPESSPEKEPKSYRHNPNSLRITNFEFVGNAKGGEEYVVKSAFAENFKRKQYRLSEVEILHETSDKKNLKVLANRGAFNQKKNQFDCMGKVRVFFDDRFTLDTESMNVYLKKNKASTKAPVKITGDSVLIESERGMSLDAINKRVQFNGPIFSKFDG